MSVVYSASNWIVNFLSQPQARAFFEHKRMIVLRKIGHVLGFLLITLLLGGIVATAKLYEHYGYTKWLKYVSAIAITLFAIEFTLLYAYGGSFVWDQLAGLFG